MRSQFEKQLNSVKIKQSRICFFGRFLFKHVRFQRICQFYILWNLPGSNCNFWQSKRLHIFFFYISGRNFAVLFMDNLEKFMPIKLTCRNSCRTIWDFSVICCEHVNWLDMGIAKVKCLGNSYDTDIIFKIFRAKVGVEFHAFNDAVLMTKLKISF